MDKTCVNGEPWKPHFALNSSIVGLKNNTDIQRELLEHGPVTAAFKVFEDFFHYKSGVYNGCSPPANQSRKVAGKELEGTHAKSSDQVLEPSAIQLATSAPHLLA